MNKKLLFRLVALVAAMMCTLGAAAAEAVEAYACYFSSYSRLMFYYDDQRSSRPGTTYVIDSSSPGWCEDGTCSSVTNVVFDPSFANARPTSTGGWFLNMVNLQGITGMREYLNTSEVTNMAMMFCNCSALTSIDVSNFNTAKVTNMNSMFGNCSSLTSLDLSNFNTANVTSMPGMFYGCSGLQDLNLSSFNTSQAIGLSSMFQDCSSLTSLDLSSFNTIQMAYMPSTFENCSNLTTIYVGIGWKTDSVAYSNSMFENCTSLVGGAGTTYDANHVDAAYAHIDGGSNNPGYFTGEPTKAYACYTPSNSTLTFYYDNLRSSRTGTYDLNTGGDYPRWHTDGTCSSVSQVVFDPSFANARPIDTRYWFSDMADIQTITGINYLNTDSVQNMFGMFAGCQSLTSLDLSGFNTSNVKNTANMFYDCRSLTSLDLSSFNTSNVTNMYKMFYNCRCLTSLDLSGFNTSKVLNMSYMFYMCKALESLDLSSFNTSKVEDMSQMFRSCQALEILDLSSFNTQWVKNMEYMFDFCKMTTIYVGDEWSTSLVSSSNYMFRGCTKLVGGMGTAYMSSHWDKTYAHIDGGPSNPGYLTAKPEAYACFTVDNSTLTFYYDSQRSNRTGMTYDLNTGNNVPDWYEIRASVTKVMFDQSFADARPTTTLFWFCGMYNLTSITGMQYLNTSSVISMEYMFYACSSLTELDLSSFNTEAVNSMNDMFAWCSYLTSIYAGDGWTTDGVTSSSNMFASCSRLVGGMGTTYDASHVDKAYAHIDGGPSNPGYFTAKFLRGDVNGDGNINISDVTTLIDYLLSGQTAPAAADCNRDGNINISDVTALIDYLLSGSWSN